MKGMCNYHQGRIEQRAMRMKQSPAAVKVNDLRTQHSSELLVTVVCGDGELKQSCPVKGA